MLCNEWQNKGCRWICCWIIFTLECTAIQSTFFPSQVYACIIYINIKKIKNVYMFLLWAGGFSWRGKNKGERGGGKLEDPVKPNLQTICTSSCKFHSRDFQVLGAHLYMESSSQEMKLDGCIKMNQRPYLNAGYLHISSSWILTSWMCLLLLCCPQIFKKNADE